MKREKLKTRLGFILLSAGCAIGIGNVWKFPYMAGQGGSGAFVLFYLIFLALLGLPILCMEFAVGRASRKSPVMAYQALQKPGQKWHIHGYCTLIGCYLLMMFYTSVAGWMLHYFCLTAAGRFDGLDADAVAGQVDQTSGPSLVFITLPNLFASMGLGRLWGGLFFLFMSFAAFSTVLAVFENIICCGMELTGCSRKKSCLVNLVLITLLSLPCVLGYNLWRWDGFAIFGGTVMDFEDFLVSNILLPRGSLVYLLFCVTRYGWGWKNFQVEANSGKGWKIHNWMRFYLTFILPLIVLFIFGFGIYDKFFV